MNPKINKKSVLLMFQWALIQLIFITPLYSQMCYNVSNLSKGVCFRITSPLCAASPANNTLLTDDFFGVHYADNGTTSSGTGGTFPTNVVGYAPRLGAPSVINDDNGSGANNLMLELNESLEFRFNGVAGVTYTIGGIIRTVNGGTANIKYSIYDSTGLELSSTILTGSSTKNGGSSGWNTFTKNITVPSCGRYFYVISHNGGSAVRIGQIILKVASGGGTAATNSTKNYTMQLNGTYTSAGNPTYATQAAMVAAGGVSTSCGLGFVANGVYQNTSGNIWYDLNGLLITDSSVLASLINAKTNNVLSSTPCPIDSDGDGLTDNIDIDDDNDAILDSVEKKCELINNGTFDGNYNNWQTIGRLPSLTYFANIGNRFPFNSGDTLPGGSIAQTINTTKGIPYRISFTGSHIAATVSSNIVGVLLEVTDSANNIIGSTSFTRTATTSYTPLTYTLDFLPTSTTTKITFKDISTQSLGVDPTVDDISIEMCDTDGDGIPNHLDLDSDNDGCSDALEGGATTDTTKNFKFSAPYGTNGLANSKEIIADNGKINYNLSYHYAIDSLSNACIDSDSDGIGDVFDLDDDNDGVMDKVENAACANLNIDGKLNFKYWQNGIVPANHDLLPMSGRGGWSSTKPNLFPIVDSYGLPDFNITPTSTGVITTWNVPAGTDGTLVDALRFEGYMHFPQSLYGNPVKVRVFPTGALQVAVGWVISKDYNPKNWIDPKSPSGEPLLDMKNTTGLTNLSTGWTGSPIGFVIENNYGANSATPIPVDRKTATNWTVNLLASPSGHYVSIIIGDPLANWSMYKIQYSTDGLSWVDMPLTSFASTPPSNCIELDIDGDGIPNHLDLDSDNDGCSDAYEAGTTFIPTSGVATANQLTATTIPAPYGTNGFANGLETVTDSGSYKGTYSYSFATNAAFKACTDTDKDGIADNNDLDDDNDGVLDTVECPVPQVALGRFGYTQTNGVTQAVDDNTIVNSSIYVSTFGNQTIGSGLSYSPITVLNGVNQLTLNAAITANDFVEWSFNSTTNPTVLTRISQGLYNTNSWKASYMISKNGGAFTALASEQSIVGSASSYNTFNTNIDNYYFTPNSSYKIRAYYYNLTGTNAWLDDVQFWLSSTNVTDVNNDGFITNLDMSCDADGDGIPNRLDLDSDGDGCSDAFEGGATTNKTDSIIAGPYGTNGLANSKETATDNGVINYNLTYGLAINNLVKTCLDTDNDGIADYIDLDDDNDGILDTDECGGLATVYLENFETNTINPYNSSPIYQPGVSLNGQLVAIGANGTSKSLYHNTGGGTYVAGDVVWGNKNAIAVLPSKSYEISYYMNDNGGGNPPQIEMWANGVKLGNTATSTTSWVKYTYNWNSGSNTTLSISLRNLTATGQGNDFRLDEITVLDKCTDLDTDGDGIINSKDLDSDNDGCSDAVEAGTTFISTSGITTANQLTATIIPAPYGTNGFANGLETVADNGTYKGTYSYSFATNAAVKACTDSDKDGLVDVYDLDDDNDGILDEVECASQICSSPILNGSFESNPIAANTYSLVDASTVSGWKTTSTDNLIELWGTGNASVPAANGVVFAEITASQSSSILYQKLCVTPGSVIEWSVKHRGRAGVEVAELQIGASLTSLVTQKLMSDGTTAWGTHTGSYTIPSTQQETYIAFKVISPLNGSGNLIDDLIVVIKSAGECTVDSDNDGIPNRLDLDSDNDGCSDAFEAGSTINLTDSIIAGPYGTNGLANSKETATDNGIINYTLKYDYAISANIKACTDTDGDGIRDIDDIDDDNDGVLDVAENCTLSNATLASTYSRISGNYAVVDGIVENPTKNGTVKIVTTAVSGSSGVFGTPLKEIATGDCSNSALDAGVRDVTFSKEITNAVISVYGFEFGNEYQDIEILAPYTGIPQIKTIEIIGGATIQQLAVNKFRVKSGVSCGNGNICASSAVFQISGVFFSKLRISGDDPVQASLCRLIKIGLDDAATTECNVDIDGDGIPNHLDLDSDNDGCSDAFEAGATKNTSTNYKFPGGYGANGLDNILETVFDNGIINYTLTYSRATSASIKSCLTPDVSPNNGIDSTNTIKLCQVAGGSLQLTANVVPANSGGTLNWYTSATGGSASSTAPTISLSSPTTVSHWVSQTVNGVESPRVEIRTIVSAVPAAPSNISGPTQIAPNGISTHSISPVTGATGYVWTLPSGFKGFSTTTSIVDTAGTSGGTISVQASNNGCLSAATSINVNVSNKPSNPTISTDTVKLCQNATASPLSATTNPTNNGGTLNWYTSATGGTASATAPTPSTTFASIATFYVSQTVNGSESDRVPIIVVVNPTPNQPNAIGGNISVSTNSSYTYSIGAVSGATSYTWTLPSGWSGSSTTNTITINTNLITSGIISVVANIGNCSSTPEILKVGSMPSNPDVSGNSNLIGDSIIYCQNASATQLTATLNPSNNGGVLNWYTSSVGGTASSVAPTPSTLSVGTTYYYVSQTVSGIESGRSAIKIVVKPTPNQPNAISGSNTVLANTSYLYSVSAVSGATSYTWTLPNGWTGSSTTNSININTNSTTTGTILLTANLNSCSSVAQSLTIGTQPENPLSGLTGDSIIYCQGANALQLTASTNPANNGGVLNWYTSPIGGTPTTVAPTPSTLSAGINYYYVTQTVNGIESNRKAIKVIVKPIPNQPNMISGSNTVANNTNYTYSITTVPGATSYTWTLPNGWTGTSTTNSININTNSITSGTITVTANLNGCSSAAQTMTVGTLPSNPLTVLVGDSVVYCQGASASQLVASLNPSNNGGVLNWYTVATGGTASMSAPTPNTSIAGITYYYVSQTVNGIESGRTAVKVIVKPVPNQPNAISGPSSVMSNTNYIYSISTVPGATSYTWTLPNGWTGTSTSNSITINTNSTNSGTISVTSNLNDCSSAAQTLSIGAQPNAPLSGLVGDSVVYCQGVTTTQLTASTNPINNGGTLNWYTTPFGGTASGFAPTPSTTASGTIYYYVSQTVNGIESNRTAIKIVVKPAPNQPNTISGSTSVSANTNYTYSVSSVSGATSYTWNLPNGWTGTSTTNSILVTTNNTTSGIISVTANLNGCSSIAQTLTIGTLPNNPLSGLTGDSILYCQGAAATQLTASLNPLNNGGILKWYTTPTGGVASTSAPTPSTVLAGVYYYYVSQTVNGVESGRTAIKVVVKSVPNQPNPIQGDTLVTKGSSRTYTVAIVPGATSYTWTLPNGWTGTSTTNTITVVADSVGGVITVKANSANCSSLTQTLNVRVSTNNDSDGDGIPDDIEKGNGTTPKDTDGDGTPDYLDPDSDNDGIPDSEEDSGCLGLSPCTPTDTDGDGNPDYTDTDSDNDGIPDSGEKGNGSTPKDTDGDGTPDYRDTDSDGDGIPDSIEKGSNGNNPKDTDGDGTPDYLDPDSDGDGIPDSIEKGSNGNTPKDSDGDGIPDYLDPDSDGDGIPDSLEDTGCNGAVPCTPTDTDGDGIPDYLDPDSDNDGIPDSIEKGSGATPIDTDGDGIPDYRDLDSDGDGITDALEDTGCNGSVPCAPTDTDGDGKPDYLDLDSDGDGIPDSIEKGNGNTPQDTDGDGIPNYIDLDSDNDGILDAYENNVCIPTVALCDIDGDGIPNYMDLDSDNDSIPDVVESNGKDSDGDGRADGVSNPKGIPSSASNGNLPPNTDALGYADPYDLDSDNDGILDVIEKGSNGKNPRDSDGDGIPDYRDIDSDGDGNTDQGEGEISDCDGDGIPDYLDTDLCTDGEFPNYITPNGDGKNDNFVIPASYLKKHPGAKLIIYNRWGNVVWRSVGAYQNDWSGTHYDNNNLPDGVYYYLIELKDHFGEIKNGFIQIMRD